MCFTSNSGHFRAVCLSIYAISVLYLALMAPFPVCAKPLDSQLSPIKEIARENLYYRWGDSPVNEQGVPVWAYEDVTSPGWQPVKDSQDLQKNPQKHQIMWLLTQLPEGRWQHPTLFISAASQSFEMYSDHRLIYRSGEFRPSAGNKFLDARRHHIPLESISRTRVLLLRVYSGNSRPARILGSRMWLGSQMDITRRIIRVGSESFVLGFLFVFAGLLSVFVYLRRRSQKPYAAIGFGVFASCIGMGYLATSPVSQLFIESAIVRYYCSIIGFISFPIGLYLFLEQIADHRDALVRRLWQLHIFVTVLLVLLDVTNIKPMSEMGMPFSILLLFGIFVGIYRFSAGKASYGIESKILSIGTVILVLSGLHDVLISLRIIPPWHSLFLWGVLAFILSLAYVLESSFAQAQRRLEVYSKELEAKSEELEASNEKLEEYSQTLEQRVEERTRQLRAAQDQLIMREKMASLGNLVAGVAHEMNNPVGAIHSSADVANRGIRKLRVLLREGKASSSEMLRSLGLLEANNEVIATGSERIAKIIQSLRSFSKLDEALFQRIDIHESIDTTLTLLQHELRDKVSVIKDYGELPHIHGYPNELNQMLMNLLSNAIRAIEYQGIIRIATSTDGAEVMVKISDTGKGIPPDRLSRIFDPGYTGVGVGMGLGLSIVYNIVQKHRGDIQIQSEVGKGTEVTVSLPVEQ